MERPNLGNSVFLDGLNNLSKTNARFLQSSNPRVTSAVTTPRQLAPTVGPASSNVFITGEARRNTQDLVIGEVMMNQQGEPVIDDSGWGMRLDSPVYGEVLSFGPFNVFV